MSSQARRGRLGEHMASKNAADAEVLSSCAVARITAAHVRSPPHVSRQVDAESAFRQRVEREAYEAVAKCTRPIKTTKAVSKSGGAKSHPRYLLIGPEGRDIRVSCTTSLAPVVDQDGVT